jgi:cyclopropane fatty-acyl-phospholipid synthase-like methyltransferase
LTAAAGAGEVAELYDWLSRYVQIANRLAYGDRFAGFTMHKSLAAGEGGGTLAGVHAVHDRLLAVSGLPPEPRVLDAGCGFGGTVFRWCGRIGGRYDGLTISRVQLGVARREARRRGWEARCRFHLQSFDQPLPERYDGIVAIETLVHSPRLAATLAHLAAALRPGGRLLVVEDVPATPLGEEAARDLALLREHWGCPRLPAADEYRRGFAAAGLTLLREEDLTSGVRWRAPELLDRLERRYARLRAILPWGPARAVLAAYLGGIAVERLYAAGRLGYRLFVAGRLPAPEAGAETEPAAQGGQAGEAAGDVEDRQQPGQGRGHVAPGDEGPGGDRDR